MGYLPLDQPHIGNVINLDSMSVKPARLIQFDMFNAARGSFKGCIARKYRLDHLDSAWSEAK